MGTRKIKRRADKKKKRVHKPNRNQTAVRGKRIKQLNTKVAELEALLKPAHSVELRGQNTALEKMTLESVKLSGESVLNTHELLTEDSELINTQPVLWPKN